jgi:hypothetical protein
MNKTQLQIEMPYNIEPREHRAVRKYLDQGWTISDLQRLTDREALITFEPPNTATGVDV